MDLGFYGAFLIAAQEGGLIRCDEGRGVDLKQDAGLGFRVLGFRVVGFRVLGFRVLGFRVPAEPYTALLYWCLT